MTVLSIVISFTCRVLVLCIAKLLMSVILIAFDTSICSSLLLFFYVWGIDECYCLNEPHIAKKWAWPSLWPKDSVIRLEVLHSQYFVCIPILVKMNIIVSNNGAKSMQWSTFMCFAPHPVFLSICSLYFYASGGD